MPYCASRSGLANKGFAGKDGYMQYRDVKELIEIFEKTDLNDLELSMGDVSLRLNRSAVTVVPSPMPGMAVVPQGQMAAAQPAVTEQAAAGDAVAEQETGGASSASGEPDQAGEGTCIKAPIVGTFYAGSAPDKPPYVKVGDTVAEGDTLCIIEAMKFMNEVPSEIGGTIAEIMVQDGDFVEFGQPLFRIV